MDTCKCLDGPKDLKLSKQQTCDKAKNQGPRSSRFRVKYTFQDPGFPRSHVKYIFQDPGFPWSHIQYTFQDPGFPKSQDKYKFQDPQGPTTQDPTSTHFRIRNPQDPMTSRYALQDTAFPRSHEFMAYHLQPSTFNLSPKAYHLQPQTTSYKLSPAGWVR